MHKRHMQTTKKIRKKEQKIATVPLVRTRHIHTTKKTKSGVSLYTIIETLYMDAIHTYRERERETT